MRQVQLYRLLELFLLFRLIPEVMLEFDAFVFVSIVLYLGGGNYHARVQYSGFCVGNLGHQPTRNPSAVSRYAASVRRVD